MVEKIEMTKQFKITLLIIILITLFSLTFSSGVIVGKNLICKDNNGFLTNGSCIVPRSNLEICTIEGKPYYLTPEFDINAKPNINQDLLKQYNITKK